MSTEAQDAFYAALLDDDPELLYERAPCGYLSTTADGTIIKVNETFLALTGYARSDLLGKRTFAELLTAGGRIYHETHYAPMLRMHGRAREIALDIVCADGRRQPVLVNSVLDADRSGAPTVIRTAVFDATERREYERELLRAKQRAEESEARASALARTLQRTLVPPSLPEIAGVDLAAIYRPAGTGDEVGGDFYDAFEIGADDWAVVIGDVCGKGVEAAVLTSLARYTLRAVMVRAQRPSDGLARLNEVLLHSPAARLCTVVLGRLRRDENGWALTLSCAGHPPPFLARPGETPSPLGPAGTLLGATPTPTLLDETVQLRSGDTVVLYTDGVTEGRRELEFYDDERLKDALAAQVSGDRAVSAQHVADALLADNLEFQSSFPRDDIAIVVLRVP